MTNSPPLHFHCAYCNHLYVDELELLDEEVHPIKCENCQRTFYVEVNEQSHAATFKETPDHDGIG